MQPEIRPGEERTGHREAQHDTAHNNNDSRKVDDDSTHDDDSRKHDDDDMVFDVAVTDRNDNGKIEEDEVVDISDRQLSVTDFALASAMQESDNVGFRIREMRDGLQNTVTLCETTASREYTYHEISCKKGEEILLINNKITCVNTDWKQAIIDGLDAVEDIDDRETCIIFRGEGIGQELEDELLEAIEEKYPLLEAEFVDAGMSVYHWIIGLA